MLSFNMHYKIPDHPIAHGAKFDLSDPELFSVYSDLYRNAAAVLFAVVQNFEGTSPVRCWPHHFDIATLLIPDTDKSSEDTRTIGVGFSPGDEIISEPYFYISPWPYPDSSYQLPALKGPGKWQTDGWTGVLLSLSDIVKTSGQKNLINEYVHTAIQSCHDILNTS